MSALFLSIIIPCYNAAKTIARTLQCFESELHNIPDLSYEIIVVNDGSTDETGKTVSNLSNPHVRYYEKQNSGVSDARNYGLRLAIGQYVWFFDADDYLFSGSGKYLLLSLRNTNADILRFSSETQDCTNEAWISRLNNCENAKISFHGRYKDFLRTNRTEFSCWSIIVRRQLLLDYSIFFDSKLSICEDVWWNIYLAQQLPDALFVNTNLNVVRYIVNQNSTVNTVDPEKCRIQLIAICEFYDKLNQTEKPDYLEVSSRFWLTNTTNKSITRFLSSRLDKEEKKKYLSKIQDMIQETNASGKIVSVFKTISRHSILVDISQSLYQRLFLRYIKPRLGRN